MFKFFMIWLWKLQKGTVLRSLRKVHLPVYMSITRKYNVFTDFTAGLVIFCLHVTPLKAFTVLVQSIVVGLIIKIYSPTEGNCTCFSVAMFLILVLFSGSWILTCKQSILGFLGLILPPTCTFLKILSLSSKAFGWILWAYLRTCTIFCFSNTPEYSIFYNYLICYMCTQGTVVSMHDTGTILCWITFVNSLVVDILHEAKGDAEVCTCITLW